MKICATRLQSHLAWSSITICNRVANRIGWPNSLAFHQLVSTTLALRPENKHMKTAPVTCSTADLPLLLTSIRIADGREIANDGHLCEIREIASSPTAKSGRFETSTDFMHSSRSIGRGAFPSAFGLVTETDNEWLHIAQDHINIAYGGPQPIASDVYQVGGTRFLGRLIQDIGKQFSVITSASAAPDSAKYRVAGVSIRAVVRTWIRPPASFFKRTWYR